MVIADKKIVVGRPKTQLHKPSSTAFNPLTSIPWTQAHWTEGPEFIALGLADGAKLATNWPDEIGTENLVPTGSAATQPTYRASSAGFNNKPVIEFDGSSNSIHKLRGSGLAQTYTTVIIARSRSANTGQECWHDGAIGGASRNFLRHQGSSGSNLFNVLSGGGSIASTSAVTPTERSLIIIEWAGASSKFYRNGTEHTLSANPGTGTYIGIILGATQTTGSNADIDVVFFAVKSSALTVAERAALEAWADGYYNLP